MKRHFGYTALSIHAIVLLAILIAAKIVIGNRWVWLLFVAVALVNVFRSILVRYQLAEVSGKTVIFKSLMPSQSPISIPIAGIHDFAIIKANKFSFLIIFRTNDSEARVRLNMMQKEVLSLVKILVNANVAVRTRGF